jgi:hypothetical protein
MDDNHSQAIDRMAKTWPGARWRPLYAAARSRLWPIVFASAASIGLLLAFVHVVRGAVVQGEQRRADVAAREMAIWRCRTQSSAALRSNCLASLDAQPQVILAGTSGR